MRLVSQELNQAVGAAVNAPANFGLMFNKMLEYRDERGVLKPRVSQNRKPLIGQYDKGKREAAEILKKRHLDQVAYCRSMEKAGCKAFVIHAKLESPFVSGLGAAHPTETGLILDHTSGVPYIPAAGQKGVMRLAHMLNSLMDENGDFRDMDRLLADGVVEEQKNGDLVWLEDDTSKTMFGSGGDKDALAGQMVVLDAYPLTPPALGEEILNPHYSDYYKGNRGPTEDQSPIPVKFLVVKPGAEFVFRLLLRLPFAKAPEQDMDTLFTALRKNLRRAIRDEGLGAKTALGLGRFSIIGEKEPDELEQETERLRLAREKEKEKQEKTAVRAAMSEAERIAFDLREREHSKDEIEDILAQLDSMNPGDKILVAEALKGYWEQHKAWLKKDFSKKHWKNVRDNIRKVKDILGLE